MRNRIFMLALIVMISAAGLTLSTPSATVSAKVVSAVPQATPEKPLDEAAVDALVAELKEGLSELVEDETSVTAITEKWDAHEDLAGKTRTQILKLLFPDVKSVIEDKEAQDSIWQTWTGEEESDVETSTTAPQKPATPEKPVTATPPANAPEEAPTKDCPIRVGGARIGIVKSFDREKGYGFITSAEDGQDVFVHYSNIVSDGPKILVQGQTVEFILCISPGPKPNPRAIHVEWVGVK